MYEAFIAKICSLILKRDETVADLEKEEEIKSPDSFKKTENHYGK